MSTLNEEPYSAMDLLLVLRRPLPLSTNILSEAVYSAFGRDCKFFSYDNYYVVEFRNESVASKALQEGILCNLQQINFITMQQFLNSIP